MIVKASNSFAADWLTSRYMPFFIEVLKNRNLSGYCIEFRSEDNHQTEQFSSDGFREKEINVGGTKTGYNYNVNLTAIFLPTAGEIHLEKIQPKEYNFKEITDGIYYSSQKSLFFWQTF